MDDKLEYFIDQTNKRLEKMDEKLDRLITFRFLLIGASMALSGLFSVGTTLAVIYLMKTGG